MQPVPIKADDVEGMVAWSKENGMDLVFVAPDDPLALGMVERTAGGGHPRIRSDESRCGNRMVEILFQMADEEIWNPHR